MSNEGKQCEICDLKLRHIKKILTTVAGNNKNNNGRVKRFNPRSPEITVKICCTVVRSQQLYQQMNLFVDKLAETS